MGRELKRVALDFGWPLDKVWEGFINPHRSETCHVCDGSGHTADYLMLDELTRNLFTAIECSYERPKDFTPKLEGEHDQFVQASIINTLVEQGWSVGRLRMACLFQSFTDLANTAIANEEVKPIWPFATDPVEVLTAIIGEAPNEKDAASIRRICRITPHPGIASKPQMARYERAQDSEGKKVRTTVMDPKGTMYYPHPYMIYDFGIADVGDTFHAYFRKLPEIQPDWMQWRGQWDLQKRIIEHHGFTTEGKASYTLCPHCDGEGVDPRHQEAYENWSATPPPEGEGYQLWETVTEGSPVSPVFETPEGLARWLSINDTSIHATTYENWLKFIEGPGWAFQMVSNGSESFSPIAGPPQE